MAFVHLVGHPAPPPAAEGSQRPGGSAGSVVTSRPSRLFHPYYCGSDQTAVAVGSNLLTEFEAGSPRAFGDASEIADKVRPAQLALLAGKVIVGREAIAHNNFAKAAPQQLDGGSRRPTQALDEHRHHGGDHGQQSIPLSHG